MAAEYPSSGSGAVSSVNGETGAVVLSAADVGASATGHTHDDRYYTETETDALLSGIIRRLARIDYDPASPTTFSTTSSSFADVDASNVAVTFTVPTGFTAVTARAVMVVRNLTGSNIVYFNLRDSSGDVSGTDQTLASASATPGARTLYEQRITGLTAGQSYTWKLGWAVAGGTGRIVCGSTDGPLTMEVTT